MTADEIFVQDLEELYDNDCSIADYLESVIKCTAADYAISNYNNATGERVQYDTKLYSLMADLFNKYYRDDTHNTRFPIDDKIVSIYEFKVPNNCTVFLFKIELPISYEGRFLFAVNKENINNVIQFMSRCNSITSSFENPMSICKNYQSAFKFLIDHNVITPAFIEDWYFLEIKVNA